MKNAKFLVMAAMLIGFTATTIGAASASIINRTYSAPPSKAYYKRKHTGPAHQIVSGGKKNPQSKNDFSNLNR